MTLTRFLTAYIYNPLVLSLTRRRLAKRKAVFRGRDTTVGAFVDLLMFPTVTTMLLSGLWHGAGYGFILWGFLHGLYITINHGWRVVAARVWSDRESYVRFMGPVGFILTFVSVTTAMVFFRSPTIASAVDLVKGIIGLNGIALPEDFFDRLGPLAKTLHSIGVNTMSWSSLDFAKTAIWCSLLMFVALVCPNTLQILARYEPALGIRHDPAPGMNSEPTKFAIGRLAEWSASLPWAIVMSAIAAIAIYAMGGPSEFLYWQF
jgi:D-alanyl-lipoteichoic acid acyltransferase DltB (MBOAT superfamily)